MAKDCQKCDERLLDYLYGELDEVSTASMRRHLDSCGSCSSEAERLEQTRDLFSQLEAEEPPVAVDDAIMAAARAAADRAADGATAATARRPAEPEESWIDRLRAGLRSLAFQPAFVTAVVVVVVGAVGFFYLSERPRPAAFDTDDDHLVMVPESELRAGRRPSATPDESSAPVTTIGVPAPAVPDEPPEDDIVTPTPTPEEPAETREDPPRPTPTTDGRTRERPAQPTKLAARLTGDLDVASAAPTRPAGSAADPPRPGVYRSEPAPSGSAGPLVIEASPVDSLPPPPRPASASPAAARPRPVPRAWPGGGAGGGAPPLPAPGAAASTSADRRQGGEEQYRPGTAESRTTEPTAAPGRTHYDRGMAAYRGHRYGDAADELGAFVRSPSAPGALVPSGIHHLGRSYRSMGNLAASARHYDDLLRRFPTYRERAQAMLEASQVHIRLGNYARATALLGQLEGRAGWAERARRERARMDQRRGVTRSMGPDEAFDLADEAPAEAEGEGF